MANHARMHEIQRWQNLVSEDIEQGNPTSSSSNGGHIQYHREGPISTIAEHVEKIVQQELMHKPAFPQPTSCSPSKVHGRVSRLMPLHRLYQRICCLPSH